MHVHTPPPAPPAGVRRRQQRTPLVAATPSRAQPHHRRLPRMHATAACASAAHACRCGSSVGQHDACAPVDAHACAQCTAWQHGGYTARVARLPQGRVPLNAFSECIGADRCTAPALLQRPRRTSAEHACHCRCCSTRGSPAPRGRCSEAGRCHESGLSWQRWHHERVPWEQAQLAGLGTMHGSHFQMRSLYVTMERSLEKKPEPATLSTDMRCHRCWSLYTSSTLSCRRTRGCEVVECSACHTSRHANKPHRHAGYMDTQASWAHRLHRHAGYIDTQAT
jgi:hypothetical protein